MTRKIIGYDEDEYGEKLQHVRETERETLGYISPRNGAYLVSLAGPDTDDLTPDELYDCAGSEKRARQVMRAMIADVHGVENGLRFIAWSTGWRVEGTVVNEYTEYVHLHADGTPRDRMTAEVTF